MTACVDLFVAKGNVAEMPDFAADGSQQPAAADRRRQVPSRWATRPASPASRIARGAALADFNLDGAARPRRRQPLGERAALAQRQRGCRPLDRSSGSQQPGAEPRRDRRLDRGAAAAASSCAARSRSAAAMPAARPAGGTSASATTDRSRGARASGRTAPMATGNPSGADNFYVVKRGGSAAKWSPPTGG